MKENRFNLWAIIFMMGIMTTLMNYFNSLLALGTGLFLSSVIVHAVGLVPSFILFFIYERRRAAAIKTVFNDKPLLFVGGFIGIAAVILSSYCINTVGVFITTMATLAGQLIFSFIIDTYGLFNFKKVKITKRKAFAMLILLIGIILISK